MEFCEHPFNDTQSYLIESQYRKAVKGTIEIFHAPASSAQASELEFWLVLI